jgi:hypothetical protein
MRMPCCYWTMVLSFQISKFFAETPYDAWYAAILFGAVITVALFALRR